MGRLYLYHERQLGNLCGVHCVNNLLQGPRYGPGDLAEIGARLDRKERKLLGAAGRRRGRGGSENFDGAADGGNFSVQVLRVALARAGLKLLPADHPDGRDLMADPARAAGAFLIQRHNHWFALREAGASWWDLDSLLHRPKPLDERQLIARLGVGACDREEAGSIFLVLGGRLPEPHGVGGGSNWHDASSLLTRLPSQPSSSSISCVSSSPSCGEESTAASDSGDAAELALAAFTVAERRAALAVVGGEPALAADVLCRARRALAGLPAGKPRCLAKAIAAAVDAVLQAQRGLQDAVAKLVALLCVPKPGDLAAAAERLDCNDLAHRLLTALARKAQGWLWTQGLAEAATIAVELLLALPSAQGSPSTDDESSVEADVTDTTDFALAATKVPVSADERRRARRDETFEALDKLLGSAEAEGRLLGRPVVSEPGLKVRSAAAGGTVARARRRRRPSGTMPSRAASRPRRGSAL